MGRYLGKAISKRCGLQLLRVFVFLVSVTQLLTFFVV